MSYFLVLRDSGEVKYTLSKNEGYQMSCLKDDSHTEASESCNYSVVWFATPLPPLPLPDTASSDNDSPPFLPTLVPARANRGPSTSHATASGITSYNIVCDEHLHGRLLGKAKCRWIYWLNLLTKAVVTALQTQTLSSLGSDCQLL
jgi:hypothetical protein